MFYTGAAFPGASALKYYDSGNNVPSLVLYRDGVFNEPTGGWQKPGRRYVVIKSGTVFRYFLILKKNAKTAILITIIIIQLFILYFIFNKLNIFNVSPLLSSKSKPQNLIFINFLFQMLEVTGFRHLQTLDEKKNGVKKHYSAEVQLYK